MGKRQRFFLLAAAGVSFAVIALVAGFAVLGAAQRRDPIADLRAHVERVTGPQPADCGQLVVTRVNGEWVAAGAEALQRALACGRDAASQHKPFWTFTQKQGIDSWVAEGLFGTSDGIVHRFSYDSAPCGGPGCPDRFTAVACENPSVDVDRDRGATFRCGASALLTRAEREAFLLKATILSAPGLSTGTPQSWRATLDDGSRKYNASVLTAAGRDAAERRYRFNIAAYELDKALELRLIPPTVERTVDGQPAALTWWIDDILMSEQIRRAKKIEPPDPDSWNKQMQAVRVFDELISNAYRNISPDFYTSSIWDNLLITKDWTIWIIDHTRTFRTNRQLENPQSLTQCDRTLLGKLRKLNAEGLKQHLGKYLSPEQLDALESRRELIVKHFDEQIARKGVGAVLYDLPQRQ
jgi:hypothetical protein